MKAFVLALSFLAAVASTASAQAVPNAVYFGHESAGSDPDAGIRFELRRDAPWQKGG
jgi:hypothetical protein